MGASADYFLWATCLYFEPQFPHMGDGDGGRARAWDPLQGNG